MKKTISILSALLSTLIVVGCTSTISVPYYKHADHGVVDVRTDAYQNDLELCQTEVYSKGVMLDTGLTKDVEKIKAYSAEYNAWRIQAIRNKQSLDRAVAAGLKAGGGVGYSNSKLPNTPTKYHGVIKADFMRGECMNDKGWTYTGVKKIPKNEYEIK